MKIKDMIMENRPREKLRSIGVSGLSNSELLALIIATGTHGLSALDLANNLFKEASSLENLSRYNYNQLTKITGVGASKASKILALFELGRRLNIKDLNNIVINDTKTVFDHYHTLIGDTKQECFYCLYLNNQNMLISEKLLFKGNVNSAVIDIHLIFKEAYLEDATSIICVHNHPSGDVTPSKADIKLTKQLIEVGLTFNVKVIDHIIVSNDKYFSIMNMLR